MPCEAEVVIATEIDDAPAVDDQLGATVGNGKAFDRATRASQMLAIDFRKGGS
jgi:hypothetical protein